MCGENSVGDGGPAGSRYWLTHRYHRECGHGDSEPAAQYRERCTCGRRHRVVSRKERGPQSGRFLMAPRAQFQVTTSKSQSILFRDKPMMPPRNNGHASMPALLQCCNTMLVFWAQSL